MERGETDLSRFLKDRAASTEGISSELIMYYWTEMLLTVKSIHDNSKLFILFYDFNCQLMGSTLQSSV